MEKKTVVPVGAAGLLLPEKHSFATDMAFITRQTGQHERACEVLRELGDAVGFFGGARFPVDHPYYLANVAWAESICRAFDADAVHGGGPSLMEATGKGARQAGKKSVGLCLSLERLSEGDEDLDVQVWFDDFGPRIDAFLRYALKAAILFGGGAGTLHELFALLDNIAKKKARPRPILLAEPVAGMPYWQELLAWYDKYPCAFGAVSPAERALVKVVHTDREAIDAIASYWQQNS